MRDTLRLSLFVSLFVMNASAADDLSGMFKEGKVSGQIRAFYINREMIYGDYSRDGLALGGKLGYETGAWNGFSGGITFYTTNKLDGESRLSSRNDKTLFDSYDNGYSYLGQAYINYKNGNTNVKIGRQELNTPMAGSDDVRMLPNTFEAAVVTNTDIKETTLVAVHIQSISYGTFANAYGGGALALASGYGDGYASYGNSYENGSYLSMSQAALGAASPERGVSAVAVIYKGIPGLSAQLWDYYAHDILNALYAQADYSWGCLVNPQVKMTGSVQYLQEDGVGDRLAAEVDSKYYGVQLAAKYANASLSVAYSSTGESDGKLNGQILTPWGGMSAFTQAMVTRHQFLADTDSYKLTVGYNLKDLAGTDTTASVYYASYDIGSLNGYKPGTSWTAAESGFDIISNLESIKGLQLRFRGNYQRDFAPSDNRDEYRLIANYNF